MNLWVARLASDYLRIAVHLASEVAVARIASADHLIRSTPTD
jgi:hypothetical protein